ncbi:MAG: hypothetical protein G8D89_16320 [gamma proteobacterium symbiont of Clathrolucina costata]
MSDLNQFQKVVKTSYGEGDFSYIESVDETVGCGDSLFHFLMVELSTSEGCDSLDEAIRRLERAKVDMETCINAMMDDVEEWLKSNYQVNLADVPAGRQQEWLRRYHDAHPSCNGRAEQSA